MRRDRERMYRLNEFVHGRVCYKKKKKENEIKKRDVVYCSVNKVLDELHKKNIIWYIMASKDF